MPLRHHPRLVLLLLLALLAPCAVLIFLGVSMIRQEHELAAKRRADEQRALTAQVLQDLLNRLERTKLQAQNSLALPAGQFTHPAVALVAPIADGRLLLPWEVSSSRQGFLKAIRSPGFAQMIQEGEQQEFGEKMPGRAAETYQSALQQASHLAQAAYARLLLARALRKSGRLAEARAHYLKLLAEPVGRVDDQGVPFRLYAASQLKGEATLPGVLREVLAQPGWLSPSACYMAAELAESLGGEDTGLRQEVRRRIEDVEQVLALQAESPRLSVPEHTAGGEPVWICFGDPPWLVSAAPPLGALPGALVAVRAEAALESRPTAALRLSAERRPDSWPLGESLPGLFVSPAGSAPGGWSLRQSFYLAVLLLVLSTTLLGAYLLWRDVRRELHMAEMRAQFVSSVSHELKTPLTAIRMFAETLRMRRWKDEQTQQEYLDTIVNESQRLTRLVDNLLDFSRIERGKKIYNPKPVSLAEVLRATARAVQYPLSQQGFRLSAEVEDGLPPVRADADALEQAILNLLMNAMKYSGDSREIGLSLRRVDNRARIEVSDHGIGIPPEEQQHIFEKFYRVATQENQLIPGAGLGLTLVEHVVKAHGGSVTVQSQPGQGSTFAIELPLEDGQ